jgi:hypothetical protein
MPPSENSIAINNNNKKNLTLQEISVRTVGVRAGVGTAHPVSTVHHSYRLSPACSPLVVYTHSPGPNEVRFGRTGNKCSEFLAGRIEIKQTLTIHQNMNRGTCSTIIFALPAFRLEYVPRLWKVAEVIVIPKPGKPPHEAASYRPISLLPVMSKLFEKLLIKRLKPIIERKNLIPNHQIGFRSKHSTIDQVHKITNIIHKAQKKKKKVFSPVFLDVVQAFDKLWHMGLNYKLRTVLPNQYVEILESYRAESFFRIKQGDAYSELREIKVRALQGSVFDPELYLLYAFDLPKLENSIVVTFVDDTAILTVGSSNEESTGKLQAAIKKSSPVTGLGCPRGFQEVNVPRFLDNGTGWW